MLVASCVGWSMDASESGAGAVLRSAACCVCSANMSISLGTVEVARWYVDVTRYAACKVSGGAEGTAVGVNSA